MSILAGVLAVALTATISCAQAQQPEISFEQTSIETREGETINAVFNFSAATTARTTVRYTDGGPANMVEVPTNATRGTIQIFIQDDVSIEKTRDTFSLILLDSVDYTYTLGSQTRIEVTIKEGVCDRTSSVRDFFIREDTQASDCSDVAQIPSLTTISLQGFTDVTSYKTNDFTDANLDKLPLTALEISGHPNLSRLPSRLFSDTLEELDLYNNALDQLPDKLFAGLTNLRQLRLDGNRLTTLPDKFDLAAGEHIRLLAGLTNLQQLRLDGNRLATLSETRPFTDLGSLQRLLLHGNRLNTLPEDVFWGLSSLSSLQLHDNPGAPFRLTPGLEPFDKTPNANLKRLASLLSANTAAMVELKLREGAPYPLEFNLTASGVQLSANSVTIPAGSTRSETIMATRDTGQDRVRIALSAPPPPPNTCMSTWQRQGQCFTGFEITGGPIINFVYDGMAPRVATIRFTSTPQDRQDSGGYAEGEAINVDVVFDRGLVIDPPITEGASSSPTLALQIGADQRTATYVVGSNVAAGILSFVYRVRTGDFDDNGVSVVRDGLQLNGVAITEPVDDLNANVDVNNFLADFPEQKVLASLVISFEESEIEPREGETVNAVFTFSGAVAMQTIVRYTLTPGTADANDYMAGSGTVVVPTGMTRGTIQISIVDDGLIERARETFSLSLDPSGDYELGSPTSISVSIKEGVCDRTPQVRDGIVGVLSAIRDSGVSNCADVTDSHLSGITEKLALGVDYVGIIATLKVGDFSGLGNLKNLGFGLNHLSTLPATVFSGLGNLKNLGLQANHLSTLPATVFSGLGNLNKLVLNRNQLTALPTTIFSGLVNLQDLRLQANQLTALPPGVFSDLANLERLLLHDNQLTTLPEGVFSGLSSLRALQLHDNPGTTFRLTLRLEPADEAANVNRVKLTLREGAPYPLTLALTASGVQLSANSVTIPAGSTQSETFTMTPSMDRIRIDFSEPPAPPNNCLSNWKYQGQCFTGFEIVHDRTGPRATTIQFTSAPQRPEGYVAGEVIRVDVVFDKGLVIDPPIMEGSPSSPTLELQIGADRRTATYVAESNALTGILSFVYTVRIGDLDENGVSVAPNGLQLNGSTITDVFNNPANLANLGVDDFLADFPEQKAQAFLSISFERTSIEALEGETINAVFNFNPAVATPTTTVHYSIIDVTTSGGDYTAFSGTGEVVVPEGATSGTIQIAIEDDEIIERTRDRFDLRLDASNDFTYSLGSQTRIEVTIKEGVCDRTSSVRAFFTREDAQASHCSDVSQVPVPSPPRLSLTSWNSVTTYKRDDFTDEILNKLPLSSLELSRHAQLATLPAGLFGDSLEELRLNNNRLNQLPADLFAGLTNLRVLRLDRNSLTTLPEEPSPPPGDFVRLFTGLDNLEELRLDGNELATLSENRPFTDLGSLQRLDLDGNRLNTLPEDVFWGLSSLRSLHLHNNPGAPFRLTSGLEAFDKTQELAKLLDGTGAVMVELKLREGAPYPLEFNLTAEGVQLSANSVTIPAGSTRSETITMTRDTGQNRVRIDFSAPAPAPNDCTSSWRHQGQCFTGFEIVGAPTIDFVYDGMGPQVATIRFTSTPQDPGGYAEGETINVDVVFDRRLVISPITEGSSSPTLALQIGADRRTATYVVGSNVVAGILSFVYTVRTGDFDGNGVSVAQDGLQLNGASVTEPVRDLDANVNVDDFLADFPEQQVRTFPSISFEDSEIQPLEGETINAVFNFSAPVAMPTTVRYALMPGTANADDYVDVAGNGEVIVPEGATSGTIQIFIRDDDIAEHVRDTFSLILVDSDGYVLGSSTRIEVSIREGICDRTPQVAEAIRQLGSQSHCSDIDNISGITRLSIVNNPSLTTLKGGDFLELDGLQRLDLNNNGLTMLPAGIFVGVGNLTELRLNNNGLTTLPEGVFDGLGRLTGLWLNDNGLTTLSATVFSDLGSLDRLYVQRNQLSAWPASIFNGLSNLQTIDFGGNGITQLPDDIFADNGNLRNLRLDVNQLRELPEQVFFGLTRLQNLIVDRNRLTELPAGAFSGYESLVVLRFADNLLESLPPGLFSDLERIDWVRFHSNRLTALPPGVFSGPLSNLRALTLDGNPGEPFQLKLRLEFAGEEQAPTLTDDPVVLRATLREGAPYALAIELQALSGTLSTTEVTIEAGSTWSGTFTVTRLQGESSVATSFADVSPPPPPSSCTSSQQRRGQCFSGFEIVSDAEFVLDDQPLSAVSGVAITSAPLAGDTYAAGGPNEEIVVELQFSGEIDVVQANDGSWPSLALEVGNSTRFASYDEGAGSNDKMVFRYKPQDDDVDDDGISVPDGALHLNAARILDDGVPVSLDLGGHAIRNAPNHKVKAQALSFEESQLRPDEGTTENAVFNFNVAVAMPTTVRYRLTPGTANADDYEAGSGEVVVPAGATSGTIQIFIVDDDLVERARDTFSLRLVDSDDYELGSQTEIRFFIREGVCDRTPQVRDAITKIRNRAHCAEVNNPRFIRQIEIVDNPGLTTLKRGEFFELERLERLYLSNNGLTTLPEDVFDDIKNTLQRLRLNGNDLTTLPEGVFDGLGRLTELRLDDNDLTTLPEGVFDNLGSLTELRLDDNDLTTLPEGVFDNLGSLTELRLDGNDLTTLPEGVFDNLGSVLRLALSSNRLTALPEGTFTGLPSLRSLQLHDNPDTPFSLTLGLEPADEAEEPADLLSVNIPAMVKLTLREGAPYPLTLALTASGVQLSANQVTIPAGSTQSETITMTRNAGEDQVRITLSEPLSPPNDCPEEEKHQGQCFTGFEIVYAGTEISIKRSFCDRTPQVQDGILGRIPGVSACAEVTDDHLSEVTGVLDLSSTGIDTLNADDFSGLDGLNGLDLSSNRLTTLPPDVFSDLSSLETLYLGNNRLAGISLPSTIFSALADLETLDLSNNQLTASSLPTDVFSALAKLERLDLSSNQLSSLPPDVFSGLVELEAVWLSSNVLTTLPDNVFSGLGNLKSLYLNQNQLASLPPDVFSGLDNLEALWLNANELSALPATVFSGLDRLRWLFLDQNELSALLPTVFSGLDNLRWLFLSHNQLSTLPPTVFSGPDDTGLPNLERLYLGGNQLSALTETVFSSLGSLRELSLRSNRLSALPATVFSGLDRLRVLWLSSNVLTVLPDDVFSGLSGLGQLYLFGNQLSALPDGVFSGLDNLRWLDLHSNGLSALPANTFSDLLKLNVLNLADNPGAPFVFARSRLVRVGRTDPPMPRTGTFKLVLDRVAPAMITVNLSAEGGELSGGLSGRETVISAGNTESDPFTVTQDPGASLVTLSASTGALTGYYSGVETAASQLVVDLVGPSVSGVTIISRPSFGDAYQASSGEEIQVAITFDQAVSVSGAPTLTLTIGETTRAATYDPSLTEAATLVFTYVLQAGDVDEDGVSVESDALMLDGATITLMSPPLTPLQITSLGSYEILNAAGHRVIPNSGLSFDASAGLIFEIEEGGTIDLTVTLSSPTNVPVAVGYAITDDADPGTADADASDYSVPSPGSVMIEAGETTAALSVPINDDAEAEPARESFVVSLMPVAGYDPVFPATVLVVIKEGVCDRTPQVRDGILERIGDPGNPGDLGNCADASDDDLSEIRALASTGITAISPGDFSGLDNLESLWLSSPGVLALPPGVFSGLDNLEALWLRSNGPLVLQGDVFSELVNLRRLDLHQSGLTALPAGVFSSLGSLEELWLSSNRLTVLPSDVFSGLPNLERLHLDSNQLSTLPDGVFSSLINLRELSLRSNSLGTLSAPMFSGLGNLEALYLWGNQLASLPDRVFESLGNLEKLELSNNRLGTLPGNVFLGLGNLKSLYLSGNELSSLSGFTFFPLTNLERLYLFDNQLTSIQGPVFSLLSNLQELNLNGNQLANLLGSEFSGLSNLQVLHLSGNQLVTLPANIFSPVTGLQELHLIGNRLATLPEGIFSGLVSNLRKLRLHDNPGAPFVVARPRLEPTGTSPGPGVVEVKLVVDETLPTTMTAALSIDGGTLSATEAVIPGGSTESAIFTATQATAAPATLTASAGTLTGRLHYTGVVTAPSELVLDSVVLSVSFEESEIEAAEGETINAVFNFNVAVAMPTIVRYALDPGTADAADYMAGSGEVVVPEGATEGTIQIPIVDDNIIERARDTFSLNLIDSDDYLPGSSTKIRVFIKEGICDRTERLYLIIRTIYFPGTDCSDIDDLSGIESITIRRQFVSAYKKDDFTDENLNKLPLTRLEISNEPSLTTLPEGLFGDTLRNLNLNNNALTTLPEKLFADLVNLQQLRLDGNSLTTLPEKLFADLVNLQQLRLDGNDLTALPAGIFDNLGRIEELRLDGNSLTTLPEKLFANLVNLQQLRLDRNRLATLPEGAFTGLSSLRSLQLHDNPGTTFRLTLGLEAADEAPNVNPERLMDLLSANTSAMAKLTLREGAPYPLTLALTASGVELSTNQVTIPTGGTQSETFTMTRITGENRVRVDVSEPPSPPTDCPEEEKHEGQCFTGFEIVGAPMLDFVYGSSISFEKSEIEAAEGETINAVFNIQPPVTMPTPVRYTFEHGTASIFDYRDVTGNGEVVVPADATSGTIQIFIVDDNHIEPVRDTFSLNLLDSDGYVLGSPTRIEISIREGVCDRTPQVAEAIRKNLDELHCSDVSDTRFITQLSIVNHSDLTALKIRDFINLDRLVDLYLFNNRLTMLPSPAGMFASVGNLRRLRLDNNRLTTLPADIFDVLGHLTELWLRHNELTTLPEGIFNKLGSVLRLPLNDNRLTALPEGTFEGLSSLRVLHLHNNPGAPFRLELGLEPADEMQELTSLLSASEPATVKLTLREGAPYPLTLALTASGVQLSADSVTIPAGSTQSMALTMTRNMDRVMVDFSEPPPAPINCLNNWRHEGQCFTGIEIVGAPTIYFVYDGMAPQVTTIRFTSTPQDPGGYAEGETINVDVVFDRGLVIPPITEGSSSSPTLALQIGNDRRTATYVVGSNAAAGVLSFVYTVGAGDLDGNGVSVAQDGLQLNGASVTEPVGDLDANVNVDRFLADFPEQKVRARTVSSISFEDGEIEAAEGETINAVFNIQPPVEMPTTILYDLTPDTADVNDYEAGSGEVIVPADATSGTIQIRIVDDALIERARETFSLNLLDSDGYALGSPTRIEITIREGVCDRTPQVQDAILGRLGSVDDCADVTDGNLSGIQGNLSLNNKSITNLKEKDFSGLTRLEELRLQGNDLRGTLPANLFAGLRALKTLLFQDNQVSTWPASIFNGLSNLQTIDFGSNGITQLPDDIFADNNRLHNLLLGGNRLRELPEQVFFRLPQLRNLSVNGNRLTELPAGAFSGYEFLARLRLSDNQLESLPPGLFSDFERANWLTFHNNRLTALPPGAFKGVPSNLRALTLGGNPGSPFRLKLRLEFADEEQAPTLTDEPVVLRATLREGAPYALTIGLQARRGTLSTTEVAIEAGSTRSGTFTVTRLEGESSVAVSFADVSPPTPPNPCPSWQRHNGQCFSGLEVVSGAGFVLDDQPLSTVSGVAITSAPLSGDTYAAGDPNEEIVVELQFSGEIEVIQANDGSWPSLALEVGNETRFAVYDDAASAPDKLVFRYKPQAADVDDDGISVLGEALRLNGARILDAGVPVPLSSLGLGDHAIRNAPNHKIQAFPFISFEESEIQAAEGETVNAVFNFSVAVAMPTPVRYTLEHGTADAADYMVSSGAGSGEVVVPADATSGTIQVFIVDDAFIERPRETFSLNLVNSDGYALGSPTRIEISIREGVCDRTSQVRDGILELIDGVSDCAEVTNDHLSGITERLALDGAGIATLKAGDFSGLGNLRELDLQSNQLSTLPADVFSGLGSLQSLNVSNNPGAPFVFARPRLEPTGTSPGPGGVEVKLVVDEPLPTTMTAGLSAEGGTLLDSQAVIPGGMTESAVFTVTQEASAPVTLRASAGTLTDFLGVETAPSELVVDVIGPSVSGVAIVSVPASGDAYRAADNEVIRVAVGFNEAVEASTTTAGPSLTLTIGGTTRAATYAPDSSDVSTLVFTYALQAGDADDNGVSIGEDALVLAGAEITDPFGNPIENTGLGSHAIPNAAGHQVITRTFRVFFEPSAIRLVRGGAAEEPASMAVVLKTEPALQGSEVMMIDLGATNGLAVDPRSVTLNPLSNTASITVEASLAATSGEVSATLDLGGSSLGNARVTTESLTVEVVRGVELVLSDHAGQAVEMIVIVAGESTEITVATAPVLEEDERVTVTLSVDPRLSLENVGSASIDGNVLVLSAMNPSATVTVAADTPSLDLPSGLSASGVGENVGVVGATSLQVRTAAVDEVTLVLSPSPVIEVQQGTRTTLRVTTDPQLGVGQITTVSLTIEPADAGLSFVTGAGGASNATVRLDQDQPFLDVEVAAAPDAAIGSTAEVTATVLENIQVEVDVDVRSRVTLEATTPQVTLSLTPAGVLELDLGASETVELGFGGFTLSGNQTAEFEVSVEGEGLSLQGNMQMIRVSFAAGEVAAKPISVTSSGDAASAGRLMVRAVGDVELAGGMETVALPIRVLQSTSLSFNLDVVLIPRSRSAQFEVVINPSLVADRQTTVTLAISDQGFSQGFAFGGGQTQHEIRFDAGKSRETVTVEATATPDSTASVSVEVAVSSGVDLTPPPSLPPSLSLQATVPRAALDLTPAGGAPGDELVLNTGTGKAVTLSLPDLTLSGDHVAVFEVSVEGEGLSLQGGTSNRQVSLDAVDVTAEVTVSAATDAASVGRLVVEAVGGIELAGGMETVALPIRVLQSVSLSFDPDSVLIQRGRSAQFEVAINPSLVADRRTTVTLAISDQGFAFGTGRTQHEIRFDADKSRETVTVATTAAIGSTVPVSVSVDPTPGVALGPLPSLSLQATIPQVAVVLSPADELRLTSGGEAPVELRLEGYSPVENQEIVLEVSVDDEELEVNPSRVTLTETMQSATLRVSASPRAESGNLVVSALSGAELVGGPRSLRVTVSARELTVSFEPSMVRLVRGGAATETASAEVSLSVVPALEGDERLVLELTSGVAGNPVVTPSEVTLSSATRAVSVTVTATPGAVSTEVVALESPETSIGNAEVSFMPLTVEVVRGVELSLSDHAGQAVEMITIVAGDSTEITVATSPLLVGDERVVVTLSVNPDLTLEGIDSELIGGNVLVLTSAAKSASTKVRVSTSIPDLDLGMGISASGEGENVVVVGTSPSLGVITEASGEVTAVFPSVQVEVQQGRSAMLRVGTDPLLGTEQAATLRLTIEPADAGLSFAAGASVTVVGLRGTQQSVDVEVIASSEAIIGSSARVTVMEVDVSEGLEVMIDADSAATLEVTTPRVVLGLRPAGGEIGEALTLNLGESKAVELSLTDFTLSGSQAAVFEVSVFGDGLSLQGGTPNPQVLQVSLDAVDVTAEVMVSASDSAVSVGELSVKALSGVELAGDAEAATLPIEVLQSVELVFDPPVVEIERGRSTQFEVATTPSLVADRRTTVTLVISDQGFDQGFSFGDGSTRHEVAFNAGKSSQTVAVAATATIGSMASVSVDVIPTSGVRALRPLPSLSLQATTPQVVVAFSPANELRLTSGGEAPVELSLADYSLTADQAIVLEVSVDDEELEVTPSRVTLTETMQSATVRVRASRRAESGNLVVSALSGAELVGGPQSLPVMVSPRELTVSFEPSMVRLVRGGAAAETASTEVSLSVAPELEGNERLVLELTSGVAGNLEVNPVVATLSSMVRAVPVRVTASLTTVSTEVTTSMDDADTSIGNAEVSLMPLTVEVVRGVELLLSDHAGQAVEMVTIVAGESTEITVATSPTLAGNERVTVTLSVAAGLTLEGAGSELIGGNVLVLASSANSSARVRVSTSTPDLEGGISASGEGENVGVVGELPSLGVATEVTGEVAVVLPSPPIEVPQGSSMTFRVETSPSLDAGQAATLRLTIAPADAGLSFADGSSVTDVRLGETRQGVDVAVVAAEDVEIGSEFKVTSTVVNASVGLRVTIDDRSEATLEVTTPEGTVSPPSDGTRLRIRVFLEGALE